MLESAYAQLGSAATVKPDPDQTVVRAHPPDEFSLQLARLPILQVGSGESAGSTADLTLTTELGAGGMGVVYSATQHSLARDVAVKCVRAPEVSQSALHALLREARLMGSLEHPGVIPVHALALDPQGQPLLVMKRIEGTSWQGLLEAEQHPLWASIAAPNASLLERNLAILMQVANTLSFAHSRGIVHRDIKPANILIGSFGEVYLADWGIAAKLTEVAHGTTERVGTPSFMAPEMVVGGAVDERTDVYLLGATLHFVLTRSARHTGDSLRDVVMAAARSSQAMYDDSVPELLGQLANQATAWDPRERPASAREFRDRLADYLKHRSSIALAERARLRLSGALEAPVLQRRKLLLEARLGFEEALREWPLNLAAKRGLSETLGMEVEFEVEQRSLASAQAVLTELQDPPAELIAKVAALAATLAAEAEEREAAKLQVRELDPSVARRNRTLFVAVVAGLATLVVFLMRSSRRNEVPHAEPHTILLPLLLALALAPVALILRKDLWRSAVNRRMLLIVGVVLASATVLRGLAYLAKTDINQMLMFELLSMGTAAAVLAITLHRAFLWVALCSTVCALLAQQLPDWLEVFYVMPLVCLALVNGLLRNAAQASAEVSRPRS